MNITLGRLIELAEAVRTYLDPEYPPDPDDWSLIFTLAKQIKEAL